MIRSLEVTSSEPLVGGMSFGPSGSYLRLIGTARGEVDPESPANRGIANIDKAPRNSSGKVDYQTEIVILRPADPQKGNGRLLYEATNRGRKLLFVNLGDAVAGGNELVSTVDLGNEFPLRRGFTILWSGWDADAPKANGGLALTAPVASLGGQPLLATIPAEV